MRPPNSRRPTLNRLLVVSLAVLAPTGAAQEGDVTVGLAEAMAAAYHETGYDAVREAGLLFDSVTSAWQAPNRAHEMRTYFLPDGPRLVPRRPGGVEWEWGLELARLGRADAPAQVLPGTLTIDGNRAEYRRGELVEWYENDERGLEQGFTIDAPPAGAGPLELRMRVTGSLALAPVERGARSVVFRNATGRSVLTFGGLVAFDATGRELPARFESRVDGLAVLVDDEGAVYPVTVDPVVQNEVAKLFPTGAPPAGRLGQAVAIDGFRVLVGAPGNGQLAGAAYVFQRVGGAWILESKLRFAGVHFDPGDKFGSSVALDGSLALIGAPGDDTMASNAGAAYLFERNASGEWFLEESLFAGDAQSADAFGTAVAMNASTETLLVGAPLEDAGGGSAGAVYVFGSSQVGWIQKAKFVPATSGSGDKYGSSVSMYGNYAIVGALEDTHGSIFVAGSAYIYERFTDEIWAEREKLVPTDIAIADHFGAAVSLVGNRAIVGSPLDDDPGGDSGAVYVYDRSGTSWNQTARIDGFMPGGHFGIALAISRSNINHLLVGAPTADLGGADAGVVYSFIKLSSWTVDHTIANPGGTGSDQFGSAVARDGEMLVGGAAFQDDAGPDAGAAYVIRKSGSTLFSDGTLVGTNADALEQFGVSVAIEDDTLVAGAWLDFDYADGGGAAYVFRRSGSSWIQEAKLSAATDSETQGHFGLTAAVSGSTIVVGAPDEDAQGLSSGALYVFTFDGSSWSREARLAAADGAPGDYLGTALAIDGDTVLAGSLSAEAGTAAGAAYVFTRSGTVWSQEAKLIGSDVAQGDNFGVAVSLDGDSAAVGAFADDELGTTAGAAYVFTRQGTTWTEDEKLLASDGVDGDAFGSSIAIDGNRILVGAPNRGTGLAVPGAGYVFVHDGSQWTEEAQLLAAFPQADDRMGGSVALEGPTAVLGARGSSEGHAYVFQNGIVGWSEVLELRASDAAAGDFIAGGVSLSAGTAALTGDRVEAPTLDSGAVYVFEVPDVGPIQAYCFGDGSGTACPCGNESAPGSGQGCVNSIGAGATLDAVGSVSVSADDLVFTGTALAPNQPALLFAGTAPEGGGLGTPFGDGLRCAGGNVVRLETQFADFLGDATWGPGMAALGGWAPGETKFLQVWFRDPSSGPCGGGFNLSNALAITMVP